MADYHFDVTGRACARGVIAKNVPVNYPDIAKAIKCDRDDLPTIKDFERYCPDTQCLAVIPDDGDSRDLFRRFLDIAKDGGKYHQSSQGHLTVPQDALTPV